MVVNTSQKVIYSAGADTFTLVGTGMLSIAGVLAELDKALFDWSKFNIDLGGGALFEAISAADTTLSTMTEAMSRSRCCDGCGEEGWS